MGDCFHEDHHCNAYDEGIRVANEAAARLASSVQELLHTHSPMFTATEEKVEAIIGRAYLALEHYTVQQELVT